MSSIVGKINYASVVGKSIGSRSYSDGTAPKILGTSVWFGGTGSTYFALGGEGSYNIGSPGTTPGIVSGFAADSRVSLRDLRLRWKRTEGSSSSVDLNSRCLVQVYVATSSDYTSLTQRIWLVQDPIVSTSSASVVEHVYGNLESINIPAGSNIFVRLELQKTGDTGVVVGGMSCQMVIDD